jgi:hypothetical protein
MLEYVLMTSLLLLTVSVTFRKIVTAVPVAGIQSYIPTIICTWRQNLQNVKRLIPLNCVGIFWYISQCSPYVNRSLGETYHLHLQGRKSAEQKTNMRQVARQNKPESESELLYNWRSVSQYVLVSSPIWDFWPEIFFFLKSLSSHLGAPSLTRGRVCHLSVFCHYSL